MPRYNKINKRKENKTTKEEVVTKKEANENLGKRGTDHQKHNFLTKHSSINIHRNIDTKENFT